MKVLLLSNLFPTSTDPNRGLFTAQLAHEMSTRCELRVVVPLPWAPRGPLAARLLPARYREFSLLAPTLRVGGVDADYLRYPMVPRLSERWQARLMYLGLRRNIGELRCRFPFDVINAHWLYPDGVAAVRLGRRLGIPVVLTGLGCDVNEFLFSHDKRGQILRALDGAAAITVVSRELAEVLTASGVDGKRVSTIPNGVDVQRFRPGSKTEARERLGLDRDRPLVVCISRLSHEKGVHVLVEAGVQLGRLHPQATIAVVGEGQERGTLEARIASLGIEKSIRLVGAVPHSAVATWLSAADVVCMPSLREGHPNAAMEALACGRPLVASRVGALKSMIDDSRGVVVPPADHGALAQALAASLVRDWDADRIAASVADSSWAVAAARYLDVLRDAVDRRREAA